MILRRPEPLRSSQENTVNARWRLPVCVQMQTQVWARRIKKDSSLERNDWAFCNFEGSARWPLPPTAIARSFIYTVFTRAWWQPLSMCKPTLGVLCDLILASEVGWGWSCSSQTNHWTLTSAAPHRRRASVQWLTQGVLVSLGGDRYGPICLLQWVWPLTQTVKNCGLGAYRGPLTESGCWSRSGCSRIQEDCVFSGIFSFASLWKLSGVEIKRRHACRNDGQSDTASHHLSRLLSSTRLNTHPEKSSSAPNLFHVVIFNLLKIAFTLN